MRNEQGEVYEFLFPMEDKDVIVYAKASLRLANGEVFFILPTELKEVTYEKRSYRASQGVQS